MSRAHGWQAEAEAQRRKAELCEAKLARIRALVSEQAEDEGIWFVAGTAPEAFLQEALRTLHAEVEA